MVTTELIGNIALYQIDIDGVEDARVIRFTGHEAISECFNFQVDIAVDADDLDLSAVVHSSATLHIQTYDDSPTRFLNGIVRRIQQRRDVGHFSCYRLDIVPYVWLLNYRQNHRIFQNKTVAEIIDEVFHQAFVAADLYTINLRDSYDAREYCVQYGESDWNFVSRLMEEEGIFYFFEHKDLEHKIIIADNSAVHAKIESPDEVLFNEEMGLMPEDTSIQRFYVAEEIRPETVTLKDYDFHKPALNLEASHHDSDPALLEMYHYPGKFVDDERGSTLAQRRLESLRAFKTQGEGQSDCTRLVPGYTFTLAGHPRSSFNIEYVLTRVDHEAVQEQVLDEHASSNPSKYENRFECIPLSVPFRPRRRAKKPIVHGVQTAIVVGPGGEEIHTNEHGQIKVQFHWDRLGQKNEHSSCWIRVAQAWAGQSWGTMFLPRLGHEVIVEFMEGDPDRPIVTGRVYHGTNKPPYALPADKTKSTIKSNSSKGGGGSNEFRFEDKAGSEEIYLHGQKDWTIAIDNDKNQTVGNNETLSVGTDRTKTVGSNQSESIGSDKTIEVGSNHNETIGADKTLTVGSNHTETIGSNMTVNVGSNLSETVGVNYAETVGAAMELTIGAAYQVTVGAAMNETVGALKAVEVGASSSENVGANKSVNAGGNISEHAGKDFNAQSGKKMALSSGDNFSVNGDKKGVLMFKDELTLKVGKAMIQMKKNGDITIKGNKIIIKGSGDVVIKGSKILEN